MSFESSRANAYKQTVAEIFITYVALFIHLETSQDFVPHTAHVLETSGSAGITCVTELLRVWFYHLFKFLFAYFASATLVIHGE